MVKLVELINIYPTCKGQAAHVPRRKIVPVLWRRYTASDPEKNVADFCKQNCSDFKIRHCLIWIFFSKLGYDPVSLKK